MIIHAYVNDNHVMFQIVCHVFAISIHYFVLAAFSWLMNEAFNLYIVITYAAHSHGEHTESSLWRYYILGWSKWPVNFLDLHSKLLIMDFW